MPETIPRLSEADIKSWSTLGYKDILKRIMTKFISEEESVAK
jgi:threonine synthase